MDKITEIRNWCISACVRSSLGFYVNITKQHGIKSCMGLIPMMFYTFAFLPHLALEDFQWETSEPLI